MNFLNIEKQLKETRVLINLTDADQIDVNKRICSLMHLERIIKTLDFAGLKDIVVFSHFGSSQKYKDIAKAMDSTQITWIRNMKEFDSDKENFIYVPGNIILTMPFTRNFVKACFKQESDTFFYAPDKEHSIQHSLVFTKKSEIVFKLCEQVNTEPELNDFTEYKPERFGAVLVSKKKRYYWQARFCLMRTLKKDSDGPVGKYINRRMAKWLSIFLAYFRVSPNMITTFAVVLSVIASLFLLTGKPRDIILGSIIFYIASIFDESDGEVARLMFRFSDFGEWYDTITDRIRYGIYFASLGIASFRTTEYKAYLYAAAVLMIMYTYSSWVTSRYTWKYGGENTSLGNMLEGTSDKKESKNFFSKVVNNIGWLGMTDVMAFCAMVFCIAGLHHVYFIMIFAGTVFLCLTTYKTAKKLKAHSPQ